PTYESQKLKAELDEYGSSARDSVRRQQWLATNSEDLKNAGMKAIKLGLDLRGGIYVTMEVDVLKFIEEQALQKDDIFDSVMRVTERDEATTENPIVARFVQHFNELARPNGNALANYFFL